MLAALAALAACNYGPLDPSRLAEVRGREDYIRLAAACVSHDEIWFFNEAGESLRIDALNLSPELLAAARMQWGNDKNFTDALGRWLPGGKGRVVLLGLYNRRFKKDDFLTKGTYRARLVTADGRILEHEFAEEVPEAFLADYFPAFNHWAKVFALRFPSDPAAPASIQVEWPSGERRIELRGVMAPRPAGG
jgi:hypothetical protein